MTSTTTTMANSRFSMSRANCGVQQQNSNTTAASRIIMPPLTDRTDLDMCAQRYYCKVETQHSFLTLIHADYQTTIATRGTHNNFLQAMLFEVQRYQNVTFGARIPARALIIIQQKISDEMSKNKEEDHYTGCLSYLAAMRVYSDRFLALASEILRLTEEEEAATKREAKSIRKAAVDDDGSYSYSSSLSRSQSGDDLISEEDMNSEYEEI